MYFERLSSWSGKSFLLNDSLVDNKFNAFPGTVNYPLSDVSHAVSFPVSHPSSSSGLAGESTKATLEELSLLQPHHITEKVSISSSPTRIWHVPRVLVADDNLLVRTSLLHLLKKWQFNYQLASCGLTAWECLQHSTFDLLLVDLQMPGLGGYELVSHLKKVSSNPNSRIPIIAMTGTTDNWARDQILSAGACAYLEKPLHPEQLFDAVTQHMSLPEHQEVRLFTDVIDEQVLDELYQGDLHHMGIILDLFLQKAPQTLQQLHYAYAQQDGEQLSKELHRVKPNFTMVGLPQLAEMTTELEAYLEQNAKQVDGKFSTGFLQFSRSVQHALVIVSKKLEALRGYLK